jgi:hypothetical protein
VIGDRRVSRHHLHTGEARGPRRVPREHGVPLVQLDEPRPDIVAAGVVGQYLDQVAALAGAEADHPQRAWWTVVQDSLDLLLHDPQPPRHPRTGKVVLVVPGLPIHRANTTASHTPGMRLHPCQ